MNGFSNFAKRNPSRSRRNPYGGTDGISLPQKKTGKRRFLRRWQYIKRRVGMRTIIFVLALLLVGFLLYGLFFSSLLRVQDVDVVLINSSSDLDKVSLEQEVAQDISGRNLLFVRKRGLYNLLGDVTIKSIEVKKKWPHRLEVVVEKRTAQALLKDSAGELFFVDEEGVIFGKVQEANLPVINYPAKNLSVGDKVAGREVNFVLYLLAAVNNAALDVESVQAAGIVRVKFSEGTLVILPVDKTAVEKMVSMVREFERQGRAVSKIDLRFQNPVVEYNSE